MPAVGPAPTKYIYFDVVGFTNNRSVEAQAYIIGTTNQLVGERVSSLYSSNDGIVFIPTGDGMCIALVGASFDFDAHVRLALQILAAVSGHSNWAKDEERRFSIRMGVNENVDNVVTDINGRINLAGAGINHARRITDLADAGQLLVGETVYQVLSQRQQYMRSFRHYQTKVKHGLVLKVHQYIEANVPGLNIDVLTTFQVDKPANESLTKIAAYYFAHAVKERAFLISKPRFGQEHYACTCLVWLLAKDSVTYSEKTSLGSY